jgi:NADPH:quinone reductase-like Zn-dependent oxidoreductase
LSGLKETEKPVPDDNEVLIKVQASVPFVRSNHQKNNNKPFLYSCRVDEFFIYLNIMKAAAHFKYGPPAEVLSITEINKPAPKDNEVLVRVHAASANRTDHFVIIGQFMMRLFKGLFKPKNPFIGSDFSGQVEATGSAVTTFKAGDKVMGFGGVFGFGTLSEYITFPENKGIVLMPGNITYEQAAGCLEGTFYAAFGIRILNPEPGQKALVYGATGAIGSAYVQFLKYCCLYVTAVCGGENAELVRSLGADKVIDYKTQDFTKDKEQYDFVFDAVGKTSFVKCRRLLKKKGVFIPADGLINLFWALITKVTGGKRVLFNAPRDVKGTLVFIKEVIEKGKFSPVIDRVYPLEKAGQAFAYVGTKQKIGNVIIKMDV